jgi:hypothetical protein
MYCMPLSASHQSLQREKRNHSSAWTKTTCYLVPGWTILIFTRTFHSILHAESSARQFQRRKKPCKLQNTVISRFWRQLPVVSFLIGIFRCSNAHFVPFYAPNCSACHFVRRNKTRKSQNTIIHRFWQQLPLISFLIAIFRCSNALFG